MKNGKYIIALVALVVIYIVYELNKPKPTDWSVTFSHHSSTPFGSKALHELAPNMFLGNTLNSSNRTVFELYKEDGIEDNMLIVASGIGLGKEDTEIILDQVAEGKTVLLSAFAYGGMLADTFGLVSETQDVIRLMPPKEIEAALLGESTVSINLKMGTNQTFQYPELGATSSFEPVESDSLEVLAENEAGNPVLLRYRNNGQLIFSSLPLAFTNYFTLLTETTGFTEAQLSLFPEGEPIVHNQYYQLGRMESGSPLRAVLAIPALRWATFVLLLGLLAFLIFQAKRKQRIIPVVRPLANLTLEFVQTLGRLYYRQSDHQNLAAKRILYWKEFVRSHYNLPTQHLNEAFTNELVKKSGKEKAQVEVLVKHIQLIQAGEHVSEDLLLNFEKKLNEFYGIS